MPGVQWTIPAGAARGLCHIRATDIDDVHIDRGSRHPEVLRQHEAAEAVKVAGRVLRGIGNIGHRQIRQQIPVCRLGRPMLPEPPTLGFGHRRPEGALAHEP